VNDLKSEDTEDILTGMTLIADFSGWRPPHPSSSPGKHYRWQAEVMMEIQNCSSELPSSSHLKVRFTSALTKQK